MMFLIDIVIGFLTTYMNKLGLEEHDSRKIFYSQIKKR